MGRLRHLNPRIRAAAPDPPHHQRRWAKRRALSVAIRRA
jgi:hypothetical protein